MKHIKLVLLIGFAIASYALQAQTQYRAMIQMNPYKGESAYLVVSLISPQGKYEKTLAMLGPDKRWWDSLTEWYKAQKAKPEKLDAVTGASIKGGDRRITTLTLDDKLLNKGYKIRFESAVEDQYYYVDDVELVYSTDKVTERTDGRGYIKTVKLNKVQ